MYVEKPLGLTIEQNLVCQKVFQETGRVFQYGTQQRSMAHCFKGCELVRRGAAALGDDRTGRGPLAGGGLAADRLRPLIHAGESRPIVPVPLPESGRKALVHRNPQGYGVIELEELELSYEQLAGVERTLHEPHVIDVTDEPEDADA